MTVCNAKTWRIALSLLKNCRQDSRWSRVRIYLQPCSRLWTKGIHPLKSGTQWWVSKVGWASLGSIHPHFEDYWDSLAKTAGPCWHLRRVQEGICQYHNCQWRCCVVAADHLCATVENEFTWRDNRHVWVSESISSWSEDHTEAGRATYLYEKDVHSSSRVRLLYGRSNIFSPTNLRSIYAHKSLTR